MLGGDGHGRSATLSVHCRPASVLEQPVEETVRFCVSETTVGPLMLTLMDCVAGETYCGARVAADALALFCGTVMTNEAVVRVAFWAGATLAPPGIVEAPLHPATINAHANVATAKRNCMQKPSGLLVVFLGATLRRTGDWGRRSR